MTLFALSSLVGMWLMRYIEVYPSTYGVVTVAAVRHLGDRLPAAVRRRVGLVLHDFMDAFPSMRVTLITSPFRDEVQVPVNPETMEPLPAHE